MIARAEQLYTRQQVCERLQISLSTLARQTKRLRPRLKVVRFGQLLRYPESSVAELIAARTKVVR